MGVKRKKKNSEKTSGQTKESIDSALLNLRLTSVEKLMDKIHRATQNLDRDVAWTVATRVLEKVKAVKESLGGRGRVKAKLKPKSKPKSKRQSPKTKSPRKAYPRKKK